MGNTVTQYDSSSSYDPTILKSHQMQAGLFCYSDQDGQSFLGREIDIPNQDCKSFLLQSLHNKNLKSNSCVLGIKKYIFKVDSTVCSKIQKCLLLCQKPEYSLWQLCEERKKNHKGFTLNEVHRVIDGISFALQSQQFQKNTYIALDMNSIVFHEGKVYLIDPLILQGAEKADCSLRGKYPSPELLHQQYVTVQAVDILSCHLFSLGIIALSMIFTKNSTDNFYQRYSKNGKPKSINGQLLTQVISNISDQNLKRKIQILTSMASEKRKNIYEFKQSIQNQQNIHQYPVKITDETHEIFVARQQKKDINFEVLQSKQRTISQPKNQNNISIRIINPNPQSKSHPQHPLIKVNPPSKAEKKSKMQNITQNKENLDPNSTQLKCQALTPKKPVRKHEFSTIKQVTEYDDMSDTKQSQLKLEGKYEGSFLRGKRDGVGKCTFPEGGLYEGEWKNDKMNGFGKLFYTNGKLAYEGDWRNNQFHGKGKVYCLSPVKLRSSFNYCDFNTLESQWISYEGDLVEDKKHGHGILILSNDEKYDGHFVNDFVEGTGTFYQSDGTQIQGVWKEGILKKTIQSFQ